MTVFLLTSCMCPHMRAGDAAGKRMSMLASEYLQHRFVKPISERLSCLLEGPAGAATFLTLNPTAHAAGLALQRDVAANQDIPFMSELFGAGMELTDDTRQYMLG